MADHGLGDPGGHVVDGEAAVPVTEQDLGVRQPRAVEEGRVVAVADEVGEGEVVLAAEVVSQAEEVGRGETGRGYQLLILQPVPGRLADYNCY